MRNISLSETAFVKPLPEKNHFHIKWFTPLVEVKLCGHATLAASHILIQENYVNDSIFQFDSLSGVLKIKKEQEYIVLDFPLQKTGDKLDIKHFQEAFELNEEIIEAVQAYDDVLIRVSDENVLKNLKPNFSKLMKVEARGIIVTAKSNTYDFVSRFFAPKVGVNEDPVTGSAHCKLAHYWSIQLGKNELSAYQASFRGGIIDLNIQGERVLLKGKAVSILEGQWLIEI